MAGCLCRCSPEGTIVSSTCSGSRRPLRRVGLSLWQPAYQCSRSSKKKIKLVISDSYLRNTGLVKQSPPAVDLQKCKTARRVEKADGGPTLSLARRVKPHCRRGYAMQRGPAAAAWRPLLQCCEGFSNFSQDCKKPPPEWAAAWGLEAGGWRLGSAGRWAALVKCGCCLPATSNRFMLATRSALRGYRP